MDHITTMSFFMRISLFLVLGSILAHARPENLFAFDSPQFDLNAPFDDASLPLNSKDFTSDSNSLFSGPSDQVIDFSSDLDSFGGSNNLCASNSMDLTALPDCKAEGSQTDSGLQARDGSCPFQGTIDLPINLFQEPLEYLNDKLGTPFRGQVNQPGQGSRKNEETNSVYPQMGNQPNEVKCPNNLFGESKIPVCNNAFTGSVEQEAGSNARRVNNGVLC